MSLRGEILAVASPWLDRTGDPVELLDESLIPRFEPMPVAVALNRFDAFTFIDAFGQRPSSRPDPVLTAIRRIWMWMGALYKAQN